MDDHEYDGFSRLEAIEQPYTPGDYAAESYVPATSDTDESTSSERYRAKRTPNSKRARSERTGTAAKAEALSPIVGSSCKAKKIRELISLYAEDESPVLITGETGVGKELVAKHIHAQSARRNNNFMPLNAGAIPETLAGSELFGHAKGAFTGAVSEREGAIAMADGGVLFLDEIGDMPLSIQAHLLRVLEDGLVTKVGGKKPTKVDFRLISATNVPLRDNIEKKTFRSDLYFRVNVLSIDVPPLRERGDDAIEIAEAMIANHEQERYRGAKITPKAADRLKAYGYPGNVRDLRNVIARALVHARGGKILPEHLLFDESVCSGASESDSFDIDEAKNSVGRFMMIKALYLTEGNISKAAAMTGRSRSTFHTLKKNLEGEDVKTAFRHACAEMKSLLKEC